MQQGSGAAKKATQTEKNNKGHSKLSHHDAEVASPEDGSVCGEEDPGSALESLVEAEKDRSSR